MSENPFKKEEEVKEEKKEEAVDERLDLPENESSVSIMPTDSHLHFQPGVDFSEVEALYKMFRSGTIRDNKVLALDKAFWIGGGINAYFDSHKEPGVFAQIAVPNEFEGEGGLMQLMDAELAEEPAKLNPILAMLIKKLVEMILEQLLK